MRLRTNTLAVGATLTLALIASAPGSGQSALRSTIAYVSTSHDPSVDNVADPARAALVAEIYLMEGDGTNRRRLTQNDAFDGFPALSSDGARIVFDHASTLFLMNVDGTGQTPLVPGSSATWSPNDQMIAFHASASGKGQPIKIDPGAATSDSDIFVLDVNLFLKNHTLPKNITNTPADIDDDPDWSPNGQKIVFTSHAATDNPINSASAEVYTMNPDGTGKIRLTDNSEEERAPSWSPDGRHILFCCRRGGPDFEICGMNADGTGQRQLTDNATGELTPSWSPDGKQIVFHRRVGERAQFQLFLINSDGTGEKQLTFPPGFNGFPNWGMARPR